MFQREAAPGIHRVEDAFTNWYLVEDAGRLTVVDTGFPRSWRSLESALGALGRSTGDVEAVVLTHGHFDHIGAFPEIFETWDVPVFAHPLELPFLTGRADYPAPDPTVGKGAMALLSFAYPSKGIDLGGRVKPLPEDGSVPFMPAWRWIHTPVHAPGHVSLCRDADRCLISGDAFVTTKQ